MKEAHILLVQWKIIGAMKNKGKNRVTFSTKKTPCNINNRKVNNPCTICARHGWCFSQTRPIQMLNEVRDWLHSRHHKVSSKPVKLAFWWALGRCFVTCKKYDCNLIMPKNWTTLACIALAFQMAATFLPIMTSDFSSELQVVDGKTICWMSLKTLTPSPCFSQLQFHFA